MNVHLSPEEFIDALDGALAADRMKHAGECTTCAAQLEQLRAAIGEAQLGADIPEPSPIFWDALATRVRAATAAEPVTQAAWRRSWKPAVALTAMAATAIFAVLVRTPAPAPAVPAAPAPVASTVAEVPPVDDDAWDFVVTMAASLPHEAVHEVAPAGPAAAVLIEELTPREREAFVKLLQREMGGLE